MNEYTHGDRYKESSRGASFNFLSSGRLTLLVELCSKPEVRQAAGGVMRVQTRWSWSLLNSHMTVIVC